MNRRLSQREGALASELERSIPVPSPVRLALAAVLLLGGVVLVYSVVSLWFAAPQRPSPHSLASVLVTVLVLGLGCGVSFVGVRMLRPVTRSRMLFGRRARTIFGVLFGVAAVGMGIDAWRSGDVGPAIDAIGSAWFSFLILRSTTSRVHA